MKSPPSFIVLIGVIFILAIALTFSATLDAQAAPSYQSPKDRIQATLGEAIQNFGLGGAFEQVSEFSMERQEIVGYASEPYSTIVGSPVWLLERFAIFTEEIEVCENGNSFSFHGMDACYFEAENIVYGIGWQPFDGLKIDGNIVKFSVLSHGLQICNEDSNELDCGYWDPSINPGAFRLAEALHSAALHNGLYEAVPEDESTLIDPGAIIPGQPESPTYQIPLSDSSKTGNIPWPIILASLGIPVTGALAGSIVSAILASRSVDEMAKAGEEFVSQVGDQVQLEADGNAKLSAQQLQALDSDLQAINVELTNRKIYVLNPYQGDPTVVGHKILTGLNVVLNNTAGRWTGQRGLSCEDYVNETQEKIVEIVSKRFPGAKVENMIFEENSTVRDQKSWGDWFDSFVDDNHNLTRVTLPDGSEWAVDFHQKNAGKAPLMRSWSEARAEWKEYLGKDEFNERSRKTFQTEPKPAK